MKAEGIKIPRRIANALLNGECYSRNIGRIDTIEKLKNISYYDLMWIRGIGKGSYETLKEIMEENGIDCEWMHIPDEKKDIIFPLK